MKIVLIIMIVTLISISVSANPSEEKSITTPTKPPAVAKLDSPPEKNQTSQLDEAAMYKLLYENSSSANDRIISTLHWSIGLVSTFILAIFGSQIFFNYRINKEEIETIQSDIDERFISLKSVLLERINAIARDNENNIRKEIKQISTEKMEIISNKNKVFEKYLDVKLESNRKDFTRLNERFDSETKSIRIDLERVSGYVWELKGVKANALRKYVETALMEINLGRESKYTLGNIIRVISESSDISKDEIERLEALIKLIPENNNDLKNEIARLYKEKRVYTFVDDPDNHGHLKILYI
jgi:hypothetical protein